MFPNNDTITRQLFTHILSYLDKKTLKIFANYFRKHIYYDYIIPTSHTLVYGEVQSGKTRKIMNYIQNYKCHLPKILIIQNNLFMLNQYIKSFKSHNISFKIINKKSSKDIYNQEQILIIINNKFRKNALIKYLNYNPYYVNNKFCLILDEADQYIRAIKNSIIFKNAKNVLHVTATPFSYNRMIELDDIVYINPKYNYIGLNNISIKEMILNTDIRSTMYNIIDDDFIKVSNGIMLITCFTFVSDMKYEARLVSEKYSNTLVFVISSMNYWYKNGVLHSFCKTINLQKLFDKFKGRVILFANRLANRGINYTNSTYTKNITHQISLASNNYTSFLQKCRIFGIRDNDCNPTLYCLVKPKKTLISYIQILKDKMNNLPKNIEQISDEPVNINITVKNLIKICKENNIKKYSQLRKTQLIQLLEENNINLNEYQHNTEN